MAARRTRCGEGVTMADTAKEFNELWEQFHHKRDLACIYIEDGAYSRGADLFEQAAGILRKISKKRRAYLSGGTL